MSILVQGVVTVAPTRWQPGQKFTMKIGKEIFDASIECFCPVAVGDIIHGELDTTSRKFWNRPIVVIPETNVDVATFFSTESHMKKEVIEKLMTRLEDAARECGETSICRYMNRMASRSQRDAINGGRVTDTFRDVTGLSKEQAGFILGKWVQRRLCRQLYLLGMSKMAIDEAFGLLCASFFIQKKPVPTLSTLYETIVENPLAFPPIEDALQMVLTRLFNHVFSTQDSIANRIGRLLHNAGKNCHTYVHLETLAQQVPTWESVAPLFQRYNIYKEENRFYLTKQFVVETVVAEHLTQKIQLMRTKDVPNAPILDTYQCKTLSDDQKKAVSTSLNYPLSAITGGPGTGKTKIITEVVLNLLRRGIPYTVAAFTGKAVARVKESAKFEIKAATLDRIIATASLWPSFGYLIIDEASMVTSELMWRFFQVFPPRKYDILLVGDVDQLPPLGWGGFFAPILASGKIPVHRLEYNYRSQLSGAGIVLNSKMLVMPYRDLTRHVEFENSDTFIEMVGDHTKIVDIIKGFKDAGWNADDITIICPYNEEVKVLNTLFQDIYGEGAIYTIQERSWRIGDRVMMSVNSYDINVMNGETGKVIEIDSVNVTVKFDSNVVATFLRNHPETWKKVTNDDSKKEDLHVGHLLHAYAITVHRSQGSEYRIAIVYLPERRHPSGSFLNINLLYTALTRASHAAWLIHGGSSLFCATSHRTPYRNDWLLQRLTDMNEGIEFERVFEIVEHHEQDDEDAEYDRMMELHGL